MTRESLRVDGLADWAPLDPEPLAFLPPREARRAVRADRRQRRAGHPLRDNQAEDYAQYDGNAWLSGRGYVRCFFRMGSHEGEARQHHGRHDGSAMHMHNDEWSF